jgi:glutathione peroxidase
MRRWTLMLMLCAAMAATTAAPKVLAADKSIYDFTMKSIDGDPVSLSSYKGKVVMVVNVASKCGFTPQYAGLDL